MTESNAIMLVGFVIAVIGIAFAVCVVQVIAMWKIFVKAGLPGWNCLVPIYGVFKQSEFTWGNGWLFLLLCIPFGGIVFQIATCFKLAKVFGRGTAFGFGLLFLPFIFSVILGFGSAQYVGSNDRGKKGCIIASAALGVIFILLWIAGLVMGIITLENQPVKRIGYIEHITDEDTKSSVKKKEEDMEETQRNAEGNLLDENQYQYLEPVTLSAGEDTVQLYGLSGSSLYGNSCYGETEGVRFDITMYEDHQRSEDYCKKLVDTEIEGQKEFLEALDFYEDIEVSAPLSGDNWYMQQISYNYILGEKEYPCILIAKADRYSENSVVFFKVTTDGYSAAEDTTSVADEVFQAAGIVFSFE